jgi:diguanylate cyclase (GGDEF)-like protein
MLVGLSTLLVLAILNRFVFEPVRAMREEMGRCAEGDLSVTIGRRMLLEFSALADAFNAMARQLTAKIEQLNQLSHYDSLTGLANRHYFNETIQKEWRRAHRSREPLSLLMLDVDHFKLYNDHYGHVVGDDCLCAVAAVLRRVVRRATDLPARYGGEEFAILMPNTPLASAIELGEEILAALASASLPHAASPLGRVSVSIGAYACCAAEPCSPACLVEAADCALYEAKRAGRNRLVSASGAGLLEKCSSCAGALPLRQA